MTTTEWDFVPPDRQLFDLNLGEVVAELARQRYRSAKGLARAWNIELGTAENVWKGHCSIRSLWAGVKVEGHALLAAIGQVATGETYHQYEERILNVKIKEVEDARRNLVRIRSRREALEQRAAGLDNVLRREGVERHG